MAKFRRIGTTYFEYGDVRVRNRVERERAAILEAISRAGELRVDILLFQELFGFVAFDGDSGSDLRRWAPARPCNPSAPPKTTYPEVAIGLDDPYVRAVQAAANAAGVNIVLPIVERDDDLAYNSLVPITAQGEILKPYRKMFPVPGEAPPGSDNAAIELAGVPVAFSICYDVHFDEVYQAARDSGAKLVFWSSMWMGGRWLVARAVRYGFYIVSSTPNGSTFVDMDGTIITESPAIYPQTTGQANLIFEDLNFDREVFHCNLASYPMTESFGKLNKLTNEYGDRIKIRNRPQDSTCIIETLDHELSIDEVKSRFQLQSWHEYIAASTLQRTEELRKVRSRVGVGV
ncbi:MAG: carbon-nitrogen hydrolase family protein [Planctomycetota bacterium]|jgi:predicted amidohydrolase|nr:carbon-nitrogen hydrolase family protein [Planctomycetota bacterium]